MHYPPSFGFWGFVLWVGNQREKSENPSSRVAHPPFQPTSVFRLPSKYPNKKAAPKGQLSIFESLFMHTQIIQCFQFCNRSR